MEKNTALDEVSRDIPDSAAMTDKDQKEKRSATMGKANERLAEVTDRIGLISSAVGSVLPDLIAKNPLGEACEVLMDFDTQVNAVDKALADIKQRLAYAREVSMPERMDAEECATFNTDRARVTRLSKVYASIVNEVQERAYQWLRDNGLEALIKPTVNSSSLSAAAKEIMENGHELPEDLFRLHTKDSVSITNKAKKR